MNADCRRIENLADIEQGLDILCSIDPRLRQVRKIAPQVPLRRSQPGFGALAGIIIAQQVSAASASAIHARLCSLIEPLSPQNVLTAGEDRLRQAGLSRPKQRTLLACAKAVTAGRLDLDRLCERDAAEASAELTAITGIGPWTAECYLLFAAGHADIFPAGDLALQAAVAHAFDFPARPARAELAGMAAAWAPWRSVAARLFWAYYGELRGRASLSTSLAQT